MTRQDIINTLKQGCSVTPKLVRAIIEQMEKDLDAHATGSMGDTQDALAALVGEEK